MPFLRAALIGKKGRPEIESEPVLQPEVELYSEPEREAEAVIDAEFAEVSEYEREMRSVVERYAESEEGITPEAETKTDEEPSQEPELQDEIETEAEAEIEQEAVSQTEPELQSELTHEIDTAASTETQDEEAQPQEPEVQVEEEQPQEVEPPSEAEAQSNAEQQQEAESQDELTQPQEAEAQSESTEQKEAKAASETTETQGETEEGTVSTGVHSNRDYSGSTLQYDFTPGERYVDKVSTKTDFDKMLDELAAISNELLTHEVEKFALKFTSKFQGESDKAEADAKKFEAFLGGYIANAAMILYDNGYRDAALKKLEQARSIIEAKKRLEEEAEATRNRVEENNDSVDLSDILGLIGD